jgi:hypothetical protein
MTEQLGKGKGAHSLQSDSDIDLLATRILTPLGGKVEFMQRNGALRRPARSLRLRDGVWCVAALTSG